MPNVEYEWSIEERTNYDDGEFDIENHDFADRLDQYHNFDEIDGKEFVLVLIRKNYTENGRLIEWEYAYPTKVDDKWILPEYFEDVYQGESTKVPKRFHKELAKRQS